MSKEKKKPKTFGLKVTNVLGLTREATLRSKGKTK